MQITDAAILNAIKQLAEHYQNNIANRFTARAIATVPVDAGTHSLVAIFTERLEDYHLQGLYLEDVYMRILTVARLVHQVRTQVVPHIRNLVYADAPLGHGQPADKVLRDMAITNFEPNLRIYADQLTNLYQLVVDFDQKHAGKNPPVSQRFPELAKLGEYLT